ncbi:hypothetical protein G3I24_49320, partial [Micromonospora aurantiaca]|nr:hypothetical protein [Micromonospora aurantiaca]
MTDDQQTSTEPQADYGNLEPARQKREWKASPERRTFVIALSCFVIVVVLLIVGSIALIVTGISEGGMSISILGIALLVLGLSSVLTTRMWFSFWDGQVEKYHVRRELEKLDEKFARALASGNADFKE